MESDDSLNIPFRPTSPTRRDKKVGQSVNRIGTFTVSVIGTPHSASHPDQWLVGARSKKTWAENERFGRGRRL